MTVWQYIVSILVGIITTPVWMIGGVVRFWKIIFDHPSVVKNVKGLLSYSSKGIGGYHGDVVICTKKSNVIYKGYYGALITNLPQSIKRMKVDAFWIEDNKLWVKILINDMLMAKLERELAEAKNEDAQDDE